MNQTLVQKSIESHIDTSLDVLDLLTDFFDLGFCFDDCLGDGGVVRFRADGVELAGEFLAEEIEGAAGWLGGTEVFSEFREVRMKAGDFLADVAAVREKGNFLGDAFVCRVEFEAGVAEALGE